LPDEIRRDEDDVNKDGAEIAGSGKDDSKYDTVRRSTSFVNCLRSTHRDSGKLYKTTQRDEYDIYDKRMPAALITSRRNEYDVNEHGGEAAGGKDDSKYDAARRSMSFVKC